MALVWRMEYPDGRGAYTNRWDWPGGDQPSFLRDLYWNNANGPDPHPGPREDGLDGVADDEYFACSSPEQVLAWFFRDGEADARRYMGRALEVTVWEVKSKYVRKGGRQCVFLKHKARLVGRWTAYAFMAQFSSQTNSREEGAPSLLGAWVE